MEKTEGKTNKTRTRVCFCEDRNFKRGRTHTVKQKQFTPAILWKQGNPVQWLEVPRELEEHAATLWEAPEIGVL